MRPLSLIAALRFARYLGRRIDRKLTRHTEICARPRECRLRKHRSHLAKYAHLFGEAGVLENDMEEALEATSGCRG